MISEKIVVVDDDARVVKSIRMILPEYEIIDFSDGEKALAHLKRPNDINLVLLDVMMPKIDGLTLLHEIKKIKKDIRVIIMTAYGSRDVLVQALRSHADDFIEKPFHRSELKDRISVILRDKLYERNLRKDKDNQVDRIKRFIDRNYDNVNLDFIADEMCLSSRYVSRMFKKKNKTNYRDYKLKVKLDKGIKLLTETSLTVSEIAISIGYQNPETFMRMFKHETKLTPSQYRSLHTKKVKSHAA